jgi:hypothetical protein
MNFFMVLLLSMNPILGYHSLKNLLIQTGFPAILFTRHCPSHFLVASGTAGAGADVSAGAAKAGASADFSTFGVGCSGSLWNHPARLT